MNFILAFLAFAHADIARHAWPLPLALKRLPAWEAPVLILADTDHDNPGISAALGHALEDLKSWNAQFDCLFVEEDRRIQPGADDFMTNPYASYYGSIFAKFKEIDRKYAGKSFVLSEILAREAYLAGIRIFATDIDRSTPFGQTVRLNLYFAQFVGDGNPMVNHDFVKTDLEGRNLEFAKLMANTIREKNCRASILMVGALHLHRRYLGVRFTSIQNFLQRAGLRASLGRIKSVNCARVGQTPLCRKLRDGEPLATVTNSRLTLLAE